MGIREHVLIRTVILSACISSIIRLVYSVRLTLTSDVTYAVDPVGMWGYAEPLDPNPLTNDS